MHFGPATPIAMLAHCKSCQAPAAFGEGLLLLLAGGDAMARANTICAVPGCPAASHARGLCQDHAALHEQRQRQTVPTKKLYRNPAERRRRADAVAAHRARYGNVCPGFQRPPHPANDLTAQHADALVLGGSPDQPLTVLCRACNSRHGVAARRKKGTGVSPGWGSTP